jgi:hypothetical protein
MNLHSVKLYAVVVQGHEDHVHHDAEGDEQLRERIEHNDGKYLKIKEENYDHGQVFKLKYPKVNKNDGYTDMHTGFLQGKKSKIRFSMTNNFFSR